MMFYCMNFDWKNIINKFEKFERSINQWFKKHGIFILLNTVFGICVYFKLISESLVNNWDGVWNLSKYYAGGWETSLGRFMLKYMDKMRGGVVSVPLNTILTLICISVGSTLIFEILEIKSKKSKILLSGIFIANPVVCITLTYSYTSVNYGMAFLFAVLSVHGIFLGERWRIVLGAICIALSMGCYQAYFGVVCVLLLMILIRMLLQNVASKDVARYILKSIFFVLAGGVIYLALANFFLWVEGRTLSAYNGASEISVMEILRMLPNSVVCCYKDFFEFFLENKMYLISSKKADVVIICIWVLILLCLIICLWKSLKRNKVYSIGVLACVSMVPLMCGAIALIAFRARIELLMSMSFVIGIALLLTILLPQDAGALHFVKWGYGILMCLFLWVNIITVCNDQVALSEGKNATKELSEQIVAEIIAGGYLDDDYTLAMIGKPSGNPLYRKSSAYQTANHYAKFGASWWTDGGNSSSSWRGVLKGICGIQLNYCSDGQYFGLVQKDEVKEMPVFPKAGSIMEIDGVIVVKVSEAY